MLLDDLYQVIEKLRERITIHGVQLRQSEALTRSALVDPLLRVLGWDTESPTLVMPEYKVTKVDGGSGTADYALLSEGNPAIVIEAKKLGTPLSDAANQCFQYCSKDGILYFAVTDGSIWDVYETNRRSRLQRRKSSALTLRIPLPMCAWMPWYSGDAAYRAVPCGRRRRRCWSRSTNRRFRATHRSQHQHLWRPPQWRRPPRLTKATGRRWRNLSL